MASLAALSILLSAGTYLLDFASNILVTVNYGRSYVKYSRMSNCGNTCGIHSLCLRIFFFTMIAILVISHVLNALLFKFMFKKGENPITAAYFLPLIHLWRLLLLVWRTLSCQGVECLRSRQMNGLFTILGVSLECIPILIVQVTAYLALKSNSFIQREAGLLKISIIASLLSAAYNGGYAVQSVADNARTLVARSQIAVASGLFLVCASLTRYHTFFLLNVQPSRHIRARSYYGLIFVALYVFCMWIFYWLVQFPKQISARLFSIKRCLTSLVFAYMSTVTGPLYPMVSEAKSMGDLGTPAFRTRLFAVVLGHILLDVLTASMMHQQHLQPWINYCVIFVGLGYVLSMFWYMAVDEQCGPLEAKTAPSVIPSLESVL